tara:strand:- start:1598 stop:2776 length:1179 start_codon:yes stop_codon:yes gene_type:complete
MKIKVNKYGIGDIRQLTPDPENQYVRDNIQISRLIADYKRRISEGLAPNQEPIESYSDGVIKSGHSRFTAGIESANYNLAIRIDSRKWSDLTSKQKFEERVGANIKRSDKWEDRITLFKQWEEIRTEELGAEVKTKEKIEFCKTTLDTTWKTLKLALEVYDNDRDIFNRIDGEGMGVEKAHIKWKDSQNPTAGRSVDLSTQSIDFIDKPTMESIISKIAMAWRDALDKVETPINQRDFISPFALLDNRTRSTIISKFMEGIGAEVFTEKGIPCSHATAHLSDHDWYFDTKSLQVEIKNKQFEGAGKLYWEWSKIKGGWHILVAESDAERFCVLLVNLEKSDYRINTALMGSSKVWFKDIMNNKTKGKDLFVLFGDAFVDSKLGAQVSLKTAL